MSIPDNIFPSEAAILADAMKTFPKHPLYKDINKKYREGFIRGQILLIEKLKTKEKFLIKKQIVVDVNDIQQPDITVDFIVKAGKRRKEKDTRPSFQKVDDHIFMKKENKEEIDEISLSEQYEALEMELEMTTDPNEYTRILKKLDNLDYRLEFKGNLKAM